MSIRMVYSDKITKISKQLELLKNLDFIKNNNNIIYYIYNYINYFTKFDVQVNVEYNIYFDIVSETIYNILPSKYNILVVNDEYLLNDNYMRREYYIDSALKLLDNNINYYFCLTKYTYKLLSKNINNNKILLLDACLSIPIELPIKNINNKFIYYEIDSDSKQYNVNLLKVWVENYINTPHKLLINLYYVYEDIVDYIKSLLQVERLDMNGIMLYNNITIIFRDKYINQFKKRINISIINNSYYSLIIYLYNNIINNNFIVTQQNKISNELLGKNALYFKDFSEDDIKLMLNSLFNLDDIYIDKCKSNNIKSLNKKITSTNKTLNKFFN